MTDTLALFPLNTVLFPGIPLPLHIFEERYRLLVRELVASDGPRHFGVVGIRLGDETGDDEPRLYDVGCVAQVRQVHPYDDGRFDIVTVGGPRFEILDTDDSRPYLLGSVRYLADEPGDAPDVVVPSTSAAFRAYWAMLPEAEDTEEPRLPDEPGHLSWLIAAALQVDLPLKQELLVIPDTASRLRAERRLLRQECGLIERLRTVKARTVGPFSLN